MARDLDTLLALQNEDCEILSLEGQLATLRSEISSRHETIAELKAKIGATEASILEHEARKRLREVDIAKFDEEIAGLQDHLKEARNNKEYAGFNTEIRGRTAEKKAVEDQVLAELEAIESEEAGKQELSEKITAVEAECAGLEKDISKEVAELEKAIAGHRKSREELAGRLDGELREEYDRLFERYGSETLCTVEDGTCTGCYMTLASGDAGRLIGEDLIRCPSCARLLHASAEA